MLNEIYEIYLGKNDGTHVRLGVCLTETQAKDFVKEVDGLIKSIYPSFVDDGVYDGVGPRHCYVEDDGKKVWFTISVAHSTSDSNLKDVLSMNIKEIIEHDKVYADSLDKTIEMITGNTKVETVIKDKTEIKSNEGNHSITIVNAKD